MKIVSAIKWVDKVFLSIDRDPSVCKSLAKVRPDIFAQGGDRKHGNIPTSETDVCRKLNIKRVDGLGKKIRSSSTLIAEAAKKKLVK